MKVAFIAARPPFPLNTGGRIRTFHLLQEISRVHDVTLVTATESGQDRAALAAIRDRLGIAVAAVAVPPRTAPRGRLAQLGRALAGGVPYTWAAYRSRRFLEHVRRLLHGVAYDLVHCEHPQVAYVFAGVDTPPRLLNAQNVESVVVRRAAESAASPWSRRLIAWQYAQTCRAEIEAHRRFDRSVVVSEADRVALERLCPGRAISIVPNGVDPAWLASCEPAQDLRSVDAARDGSFADAGRPPLMVFTGSMDWLPNIDGVNWFVDAILPRIRQRLPAAELWVVGRTPSPGLRRRWTDAGVRVIGTVDDMRPYVARADLVVVPLRIGGGTRLKILEAWAMRQAVLSTTVGAEGLPAADGENIALADAPGDFAVRAVALLRNPHEVARLGAAGRRIVEAQFTWPHIASHLLRAYEETLASARRRARALVPSLARPAPVLASDDDRAVRS